MSEKMLDAALRYAERGLPVFPARGKVPFTEHGFKDASRNAEVIRKWWLRWPDANIAIPTGTASGLIVLDVDPRHGGNESLVALEVKYRPLPSTLEARTGSGGRHFFFAANGHSVRNSAGKLGSGLDVRGDGGYVVLPPSIHPDSRKPYTWARKVKPAPVPPWLCEPLPTPTSASGSDTQIPEGQRNGHLTSLAGAMRRRGMTQSAIEAALLEENVRRCRPPLPESEAREIAKSISRYEPADRGAFKLEALSVLLNRPQTETEWLWSGHLAVGTVSIVASKPKVGKSTFARNLCLAVARGEQFLGRPAKKGLVIYLALEERAEDVTADFRAMGANGDENILIHADRAPASGIFALVDLVRERKPALVVIDPLFRLARVKDEKAYAEVYAALGPLIDVSRETGTHLLLPHHSGKSPKADAIDSPLGSTALAGAVSTLIVLRRTETYRLIQTVQRLGEDLPETVLKFDPEAKLLSLGDSRADTDRAECEKAVLDYLQAAGEPQTQQGIRDGVEGKTKVIRAALTNLTVSGRVNKSGDGTKGSPFLYEFPNSGSQHIAGTREPESQKQPQPSINAGDILVPTNEQKSILVPEKIEVEL